MTNILKVNVDGQHYEIDIDKLTFAEGRAIEKVSGKSMSDALKSQDLTTVQALIWVTMKRSSPGVKFTDLDDRAIDDFEIETDLEDKADFSEPATD